MDFQSSNQYRFLIANLLGPTPGQKVCGSFCLLVPIVPLSLSRPRSSAPPPSPKIPPPQPPSRPHQPFPRSWGGGKGGGGEEDTTHFFSANSSSGGEETLGNAARRTAAGGMQITHGIREPKEQNKNPKPPNCFFFFLLLSFLLFFSPPLPFFCQLSPYLLGISHPTMVTLPRSSSLPFKHSVVVFLFYYDGVLLYEKLRISGRADHCQAKE